ncbi:MAG: lysostaphin resistance A-like protein [Promethearchaeota archaeon]
MSTNKNDNSTKRKFQFSEHMWISIFVLMLLYVFFNILATIITLILTPAQQPMSPITLTIILFACDALCFFLLVPLVLHLPDGKKDIPEYLKDIRVRSSQPIIHILALGLSCYFIYMLSQLLGSLIYGQYSFDIYRALPPNSWGLLESIPLVFFEEILMRGLILTLLLKKYLEKQSILISAAIFGSYHILNLLNYVPSVSYETLKWTLGSMVWAFIIGLFYSYTFIKTKSLLPCIIVHYLSNTLINLWVFLPAATVEIHVLYGIIFGEGIIPTALSILWVKFYTDRWLPVSEGGNYLNT